MSRWWWKAEYFETCNCDYGCPCNLNSIPTDGTCKAIDAWRIREGAAQDVRLDGLTLALLVAWPNPIHEGNGQAVVYIDERADGAQREALAGIGTGAAGPGGPFEIFAGTYSEPPRVVYGPVALDVEGSRVSMKFGDLAHADLAPIRATVDGSESSARMVLPGGFIWQDAEMVNTETCEVNAGTFAFRYQDSSAFLSQVEYNV